MWLLLFHVQTASPGLEISTRADLFRLITFFSWGNICKDCGIPLQKKSFLNHLQKMNSPFIHLMAVWFIVPIMNPIIAVQKLKVRRNKKMLTYDPTTVERLHSFHVFTTFHTKRLQINGSNCISFFVIRADKRRESGGFPRGSFCNWTANGTEICKGCCERRHFNTSSQLAFRRKQCP